MRAGFPICSAKRQRCQSGTGSDGTAGLRAIKAAGGLTFAQTEESGKCTFARQNITADPPFSRLDLLSCRNVLIYLSPQLPKRCIPQFHYALSPAGYLILGPPETVRF